MFGFIIDNVGLGELLLISLVALMVFGPEKTPELARKAGKAARKLTRMMNEFKNDFDAFVDFDEDMPARHRPVKKATADREMLKDIVKSKAQASPPEQSAAPIVRREEASQEPAGEQGSGEAPGVEPAAELLAAENPAGEISNNAPHKLMH